MFARIIKNIKIMNAIEAQEKAQNVVMDSIPIHFKEIMKKIEDTANAGYFSTYYDKGYSETYKILKEMIKKEGFSVSIESDGYSGLRISWK